MFPFRLAALDLHGPPRPPGEALTCTAAIELVGDALVRSDIDVAGADGRCWMRLTGWEDRRFEVPERFRALAASGELPPLSASWDAMAAVVPGAAVACRRLDARLPADAGLWKDVWARRVLGRRERERFDALRQPERRQLEWLGARTAAKEAVIALLRDGHGIDLRPADVEILPDAGGAPRVAIAGLEDLPVAPVVSLAHAAGQAVGARGPGPARQHGDRRDRRRGPGRTARGLRRGRPARRRAPAGGAGRARGRRGMAAALLVRQGGGRQGGRHGRRHRRRGAGRARRRPGARDGRRRRRRAGG